MYESNASSSADGSDSKANASAVLSSSDKALHDELVELFKTAALFSDLDFDHASPLQRHRGPSIVR